VRKFQCLVSFLARKLCIPLARGHDEIDGHYTRYITGIREDPLRFSRTPIRASTCAGLLERQGQYLYFEKKSFKLGHPFFKYHKVGLFFRYIKVGVGHPIMVKKQIAPIVEGLDYLAAPHI
jgi:hypothetical protein